MYMVQEASMLILKNTIRRPKYWKILLYVQMILNKAIKIKKGMGKYNKYKEIRKG